MFVVTFYSYKGGVGRTLSLINSAQRLAKKGKKVFVLDFDLEAPGIDSFPLRGDMSPRQGIVEYISRFTSAGSVEDLSDYVYQLDYEQFAPGEIRVMPAGRKDERYQVLLSRLDWKYFYKERQGFLFVENLKAAIEDRYHPDYVLIDSRTGLTDISGICTLQLPDLVVLLFSLNNQNINGIAHMYRSIASNKFHKGAGKLLVASPIPDIPDYFKIRRERLEYAEKTIGAERIDLVLPFDPFVTFQEAIVNGGEEGTHLGRSYDNLTNEIISANKGDLLTLLEEASDLVEEGEIDQADLKYRNLLKSFSREPRALLEYGRFRRLTGKRDAAKYLEKARALNPRDPDVLSQLIRVHLKAKRMDKAGEYLDDFVASCEDPEKLESAGEAFEAEAAVAPAMRLYERAIELSEHPTAGSHSELGNIYMQAKKIDLAINEFESATKIDPNFLPAVYNYGYALNLARDPRAPELFLRAIQIFEQQDVRGLAPAEKANQLQAMSHAYSIIGMSRKAEELLESAIRTARKIAPRDRIFSSVQYRSVRRKDFIEETLRLMKELRTKKRLKGGANRLSQRS